MEQKNNKNEKQMELYQEFLLIAQLTEKFYYDKALLRAMKRLTGRECKRISGIDCGREANQLIAELESIVISVLKAAPSNRYHLVGTSLANYIVKVEGHIAELKRENEKKQVSAEEVISAVAEKAKTIEEAIGKGVEGLKNKVKSLRSK